MAYINFIKHSNKLQSKTKTMIKDISRTNNYIKLLNNKSRSIDCVGFDLAAVHQKIGRIIGAACLDEQPLVLRDVINPQGLNGKSQVPDCNNITIIGLLRSGLYLSLGIRESLAGTPHIFHLSQKPDDIDPLIISGRVVIIADAVVNSGETIKKYMSIMQSASMVYVTCLVMQQGFANVATDLFPDVNFITGRISENFYIGTGKNDTGNRLFGTY